MRVLPLLLRREVEVSTAELIGLQLNLQINEEGRSNWQDFIDAAEYRDALEEEEAQPAATGTPQGTLEVAGVEIRDSVIRYADASTGTNVSLSDINIVAGNITSADEKLIVDGFSVGALLEGLFETPSVFGLETSAMNLNTDAEMIVLGQVDLSLLGLDITAAVEPISYAGELTPKAAIQVDAFSLRNLMERMDIEPPETSDPAALGRVTMSAVANVGADAIRLTDLTLGLDETTFTGSLAIPQGDNDVFELELNGDSIVLDRYMAPVTEVEAAAPTADAAPVEIPAELIRLMNARGSMTLGSAQLGAMQFTDIELGVLMDEGNLRMHPIKATLFEGQYNGDVRIDASGSTPVLSVNEQISGVQLGTLAKALFDRDNITGTINGSFELAGRGADLGAIQRDLDGNISMEFVDGAFEGTDIWHELRKARALIRQEEPPEAKLPARTPFGQVRASGPVTDGVFSNDDLFAELPFMQLTGKGSVNLVEATVDYRMNARVFEKPEFVGEDVTADELKDLSKTRIPIRITGPIADPSVQPDVEKLLQDRAKEEVEDLLKDKLKDLFN